MSAANISSLYRYYIYSNLTQSLLARKKGNLIFLPENDGAVLLWGPSVFIGGDFSKANGEKFISILGDFDSPRYLYYPNDAWRSFIQNTFGSKLKDIYLHVYQADFAKINEYQEKAECILPVTRDFIAQHFPHTELITDELYSYTDMEDFFQNGYGLALVMDGEVSGFCLGEYSVDNSHGINIWIDERYRRLGYAKKMVNAFLMHCREQNQNAYWACNADNIQSNKVAVASGFVLKSTMHYFEV